MPVPSPFPFRRWPLFLGLLVLLASRPPLPAADAPSTPPPAASSSDGREQARRYLAQAVAQTTAIKDEPARAIALSTLVATQVKAGDLEGAHASVRALDEMLSTAGSEDGHGPLWAPLEATYCDLWNRLVTAQFRAGDVSGAVSSARALPSGEDFSRARLTVLCTLGSLQAKADDVAGTRRTLEATAKEDDHAVDDANVLRDLAAAQARAGDLRGALATAGGITVPGYERVEAIDRTGALGDVAIAQAEAGDVAGAKATVETKVTPPGNKDWMWSGIAVAQARAGDVPGASVTLGPIKEAGSRALALAAVGSAQWKAGDQAASRRSFGGALAALKVAGRDSEDWEHVADLVTAQLEVGDLPGALTTFQAIKDITGVMAVVTQDLAVAQAKAGNLPAARALLKRVTPPANRKEDTYTGIDTWPKGRVAAALARIDGFPAAERWVEGLKDPLVRVSAYVALAEAALHPDAPVPRVVGD